MNTKIAYITDIHLDESFPKELGVDARKNWTTILNDIASNGINEIVYGGDIGEESSNAWFFNTLRNYKLDISLGNHDSFEEVIKHYNNSLAIERKELYYSKFAGNYKLIFLDSSSGSISEKQFDWLKEELIASESIILFIHHPILSVNVEVDRRFALTKRKRIEEILSNVKNDVSIFSGHYHLEDEQKSGNIRQYITPAASYQVEKTIDKIAVNKDTFGYRIIELSENEINTSVVLFS